MIKEKDQGYFRAPRFAGVALRVVGYPRKWEPSLFFDPDTGEDFEADTGDGDWYDDVDGGRVLVRMVGDDRDHELDRDELQPLKRSEFCGGCGQIGCGCDPYDGDDE
jgi:hypothetical protein